MTIAACYVCSEGVVLGADSTSTVRVPGRPDQHYNHEQKVFEIGEGSTLALAMWGVGGLEELSYRTMIARLADGLCREPAQSVEDVANRWIGLFSPEYTQRFGEAIRRYRDLARISPRTEEEELEFLRLSGLSGGFCIGGYVLSDRVPHAFEIVYGPDTDSPSAPRELTYDLPRFWACPNLLYRLLFGIDVDVASAITQSPCWSGSHDDLFNIIRPAILTIPGSLPLREAIDWIYSTIYITIKAIKFSCLAPVCGGPIEVAAISSDRHFRWVTHKGLGQAIIPPGFRKET